jgi:hypothetical protein
VITPAKKVQIDLLQRLRDSGSITDDSFEIERAKIILAPAESGQKRIMLARAFASLDALAVFTVSV